MCAGGWPSERQFRLVGIVDAALDLVGRHLGDAAGHLEFGGRVRAVEGDSEAEAELAVFIGAVLGVIEMEVEEFLHRIDGGLFFGGLGGVHGFELSF